MALNVKWIESGENVHVIWNSSQSIIKQKQLCIFISFYECFSFIIWLFYFIFWSKRNIAFSIWIDWFIAIMRSSQRVSPDAISMFIGASRQRTWTLLRYKNRLHTDWLQYDFRICHLKPLDLELTDVNVGLTWSKFIALKLFQISLLSHGSIVIILMICF